MSSAVPQWMYCHFRYPFVIGCTCPNGNTSIKAPQTTHLNPRFSRPSGLIVLLTEHGEVRRMPRVDLLLRINPVECLIDCSARFRKAGRDQLQLPRI